MTGIEVKELRDTIEKIDRDEHNGVHIIGYFPLSDALIKEGYRKESVVVDEVIELVRLRLQPSCLVEDFLDRIRKEYHAGGILPRK